MKLELNEILSNSDSININDVYDFFSMTSDILLIKYDGIRESSRKYNVIIIGKESRFETINFEIEDLQEGIRQALTVYQKFV